MSEKFGTGAHQVLRGGSVGTLVGPEVCSRMCFFIFHLKREIGLFGERMRQIKVVLFYELFQNYSEFFSEGNEILK